MSIDAKSVAQTYFTAWQAKDAETLRSLLAENVKFTGPMGTADGIDECVDGLMGLAERITDIDITKMFVDGPDVVTWYDLHTADADPTPTVNWSHLKNGKITRIRAIFDSRVLMQSAK